MSVFQLDQLRVVDPQVREEIAAGRTGRASVLATRKLAAAISDAALTELVAGHYESGIKKLQDALNMCPASQETFHNLTATLLSRRQLRHKNLDALQEFVIRRWADLPWLQEYDRLLYAPHFLNIEFVSGKCNSTCRMCLGTQRGEHPNRLSYVAAEDLGHMLEAAPTARGVTLSSGDSDPLLHPEIERVLEIGRAHGIAADLYTNGLALNARICRQIVESQVVKVINFSIGAATPETYRRVRGEGFERVIRQAEMLQGMKRERNYELPWVSTSFVAMADNIAELPDFVSLAQRLGSRRVYVEGLVGWRDDPCGNYPATDNPRCFEFVRAARRRAEEAHVGLQLPESLREPEQEPQSPGVSPANAPVGQPAEQTRLPCCGWLWGVWVKMNGAMHPCCTVANVADMGNILDGPLFGNDKFSRVKELLLSGKVFDKCAEQRNCTYVQQQLAAGNPLRFITPEELGDLHPAADGSPRGAGSAREVAAGATG